MLMIYDNLLYLSKTLFLFRYQTHDVYKSWMQFTVCTIHVYYNTHNALMSILAEPERDMCHMVGAKSFWLWTSNTAFLCYKSIVVSSITTSNRTSLLCLFVVRNPFGLLEPSCTVLHFSSIYFENGKSTLLWQEWTQEGSMDTRRRP